MCRAFLGNAAGGIRENVVLLDSVRALQHVRRLRIGALLTHNKEVLGAALKSERETLPSGTGSAGGEAAIDTPKEYLAEVYDDIIRRDFMVKP